MPQLNKWNYFFLGIDEQIADLRKQRDLIINRSRNEIVVRTVNNYPCDEDDNRVLWCNTSHNVSDVNTEVKQPKYDLSQLPNGINELTWLNSDSESGRRNQEFDMQYMPPEEPVDTGYKNMEWLRQQMVDYFNSDDADGGMSIWDLSSTVFETMNSATEDSELQSELFDLLGFDRFELIQILLKNRNELVYNIRGRPITMLHAQKKAC